MRMITIRTIQTLAFLLLVVIKNVEAQTPQVDSLKLALKKATHDTLRCNILNMLAEVAPEGEWQIYNEQLLSLAQGQAQDNKDLAALYLGYYATALSNNGMHHNNKKEYDRAAEYFEKSLKVREQSGDKAKIADALGNLGLTLNKLGQDERALQYLYRALDIRKEVNDKPGTARILSNLGFILNYKGRISEAIDCFMAEIKIKEETNNRSDMASSLCNLGYIYNGQGDTANARECFMKALDIAVSLNNREYMARVYNNLGALMLSEANKDAAIMYFKKAINELGKTNNSTDLSSSLNNLGSAYNKLRQLDSALKYYSLALHMRRQTKNLVGLTTSCLNMGIVNYTKKNYVAAEKYASESLEISRKLGYPENISRAARLLYAICKSTGRHKEALRHYELHVAMNDSVHNESTRKASIKSQLKYEYEKQAAADSVAHAKESEIKNAELQKQKAEIKAKKNQQYALFGGLALVIIFAGFMYNRFKITQKQKGIIEDQKKVVEEQKLLVEMKQKEIVDSINYARRIQLTQIPNEMQVFKMLQKFNMKGK